MQLAMQTLLASVSVPLLEVLLSPWRPAVLVAAVTQFISPQ